MIRTTRNGQPRALLIVMAGNGCGRILIVEDDDVERNSLIELLRLWGYDAKGAPDGRQALQEVASAEFDLVISDVCMPRMSGIELLQELRQKFHFVSCVMITGQENELDESEAMRLGARGFLRKPVHPDELKGEIRRSVDARWKEAFGRPA
jgi:CheY-like chemotaxis protein